MRSAFKTGRVANGNGVITIGKNGVRMRTGQTFGRWGFILGNVLIAFGAPVFVSSLVATVSAGRGGTAARGEDVAAIAAGALFMITGLIATVTSGRARQAVPPAPARAEPSAVAAESTADPAAWAGRTPATDPLPLTLNTLDDYYTRPGSGVALFDDEFVEPYHVPRAVPRPRNARANMSGDRFCEPSSVTGTRSTGSRRRPQGG